MQIQAWDAVAENVNFNLKIDILKLRQLVALDTPILDYGCGYGRTCQILSLQGYTNVVGVDSSSEMIKRGIKDNPRLSLIQNNRIETNFSNKQFGAIILCAVLTCIPEIQQKEAILNEITRLLKLGGVLHLVEFCSDSDRLFESKLGITMHHQKSRDLDNLLKSYVKSHCETIQTTTMSGEKAKAMSFFGKREF